MRQLVTRGGRVQIEELPIPVPQPGELLVKTLVSAVSIGTERKIVIDSGLSTIDRVRRDPALLKQAIGVLRSGGLKKTVETYESVMRGEAGLGYSSCGRVIAVGERVTDFKVGDIVACGGGGKAVHAEFVTIPRNLAVRVPSGVQPLDASFAAIASIAIHGLRRANCSMGDVVAVVGLGFLGALGSRIAACSGMRVVSFDPEPDRAALLGESRSIVATSNENQFRSLVRTSTDDHGADAVLIFAASDDSSPVDLAMEVIRNEGRVVLVGNATVNLDRDRLYDSEAEFSVSRSYGPGRYDLQYEDKGLDYPYEYVRWTENRNMHFYLDLVRTGKLAISDLITHRIDLNSAPDFFDELVSSKIRPMGTVILYGSDSERIPQTAPSVIRLRPALSESLGVGIIGAGSFAQGTILPILKSLPGVHIAAICGRNPLSTASAGERWGAGFVTANSADVIDSDDVAAIVVSTPHNLHASSVVDCIERNKPVYVEKPLALSRDELDAIVKSHRSHGGLVMVGFNRRYSPLIDRAKDVISRSRGPKIVDYEVHVPSFPVTHWVNDPEIGGGRLVGEGCHFLDLTRYLLDADWRKVTGTTIPVRRAAGSSPEDFVVSVDWHDGSFSTLHYTTLGAKSLPKEAITIHADSQTIMIRDFGVLEVEGRETQKVKLRNPDKGHRNEIRMFIESVRSGIVSVQPLEDAVKSTLLTLEAQDAIKKG